MRAVRIYRGFVIVGRKRTLRVKWLLHGIRAIRLGHQVQLGRLLLRVQTAKR